MDWRLAAYLVACYGVLGPLLARARYRVVEREFGRARAERSGLLAFWLFSPLTVPAALLVLACVGVRSLVLELIYPRRPR